MNVMVLMAVVRVKLKGSEGEREGEGATEGDGAGGAGGARGARAGGLDG